MTISINITTPDNKRAKVTRSDGVESFVEPGTTGSACIFAEAPSVTIEYLALDAAKGGGTGSGDGPPP